MIVDSLILIGGKAVHLESNFTVSPNTDQKVIIDIEKKLDDYDTNSDGFQSVESYDPDFRFRYFMSIFGPRLILRNGVYRYDFHQGTDIIDLERPDDTVAINNLPDIQCICDGTVVEYVKLDNPDDLNNPIGIGRKTSITCAGDTVIGSNLLIESTGAGQYVTVKCDTSAQYPMSLGFSNNDIYTAYRHLTDFSQNFSIGDTIKRGALIGKMGETGITSNHHLHFSALRRGCSEVPAKGFINVHPMFLFNPDYNPHLLRKLEYTPAFDNNASPLIQQEINPEISFLNYDTITKGSNPIIRIALPYSQTSIHEIIIRDKNGNAPTHEWNFDFLERGILNEAERDQNHWDMNGNGQIDTVYIHHFNRGTSAQYLYNEHKNEPHYNGHPGRDWPISNTGLYRTSTYIMDIKITNYTGDKNDLEVEVRDIWGYGIKGVIGI